MIEILTIPIAALINRVRGGLWGDVLPGHGRVWAFPAMGLLSLLAGAGWLEAVVWALGYLVWSAPAWGRWYDLSRKPASDEPPSKTELIVEAIASRLPTLGLHPDYACLFVRHMLVLPTLVALALLTGPWWLPAFAFVFAALTVVAYEIGRLQSWFLPLVVAEPLAGAVWGALLLITF